MAAASQTATRRLIADPVLLALVVRWSLLPVAGGREAQAAQNALRATFGPPSRVSEVNRPLGHLLPMAGGREAQDAQLLCVRMLLLHHCLRCIQLTVHRHPAAAPRTAIYLQRKLQRIVLNLG